MKAIIVALLLLPAGICVAQDKFTITGKLPNAPASRLVFLSYTNSEGKSVTDSVVLKKGSFAFTGTTLYANRASLSLRPIVPDTGMKRFAIDFVHFYLEKGSYKVVGKDSLATAKITGAQSQTEYLQYNALTETTLKYWKDINTRFSKVYYAKVKDTVAIKAIQAEARPVYAKIEATLDSFIFSHPDSYVTADLVNDNKTAVIDSSFEKYYAALSPRVMGSFTGQKITAKYDKAKQIAIGKKIDFTQPDTSGTAFTLSSLKGKYVLVDFWASWCTPCRAENPNLLKAYKELKDKNFEIVGVSVDDKNAPWVGAVLKDGMPWVQVSDLRGFRNEVAVKYGINAVPQNMLIDPDGVIVAKNLRGEGLTEELKKYIK